MVDAAIVDGTAVLTTMIHGMLDAGAWQDRRGVNLLDTGAPFYDVYRCADGQFVAVGALEEQFYAALLDGPGAGRRRDAARPERPAAVAGAAGAVHRGVRSRTRDEWWTVFAGTDACVAPVWSLLEATRDAHNARARGVRRGRRHGCSPTSPRGSRPPPAPSAGCRGRASTATRSAPSSASDALAMGLPRRTGGRAVNLISRGQRRRVSGKSRSTNRSTTGCGSWLASPGRSLASMNT